LFHDISTNKNGLSRSDKNHQSHEDRENLVRVPLKKFQTAVHEELGFYASSGDRRFGLATGSHLTSMTIMTDIHGRKERYVYLYVNG